MDQTDSMNLFERLEMYSGHFSKGQKKIADFIKKNYDKLSMYTASRLGNEVGVSESTVVRFAYELHYDGYPELQKAIGDTVRTHSNSIQRLENAAEHLKNKEDVISSILHDDRNRIYETEKNVDREVFGRVVDEICSARNIYILGVRSTWYLAGMLGYYFQMIFDSVHVLEGSGTVDTFEQMTRISAGDVFIGISFPRYSRRTVRAMELAKKHGARTITITDSMQSPLIEFADYPLIAKSDVLAIVDSMTAPVSLINALVVAVSLKNQDSLKKRLDVLENLWQEYKVYDDHVID